MNARRIAVTFLLTLTPGICAAGLTPRAAGATAPIPTAPRADSPSASVGPEVRHLADWAVRAGDHQGLPFIIVDKIHANAAAFDRRGKLLQTTPVLIGMGIGDIFEPGVINMTMYQTKPSQRITPAGRFFADEDLNDKGERVLWVDYDAGIALHKLPAKKTKQRRHERIMSHNPADHRITYGCINVPPAFYDQVVGTHFRAKGGIVYVLPDSTPANVVFKSYGVGERRVSSAEQPVSEASLPTTQPF